jgi:hypothetical protein
MKRQSGNIRPGTIFEVEAKPIGSTMYFDAMIAIVDASAEAATNAAAPGSIGLPSWGIPGMNRA